MKQHDPPKRAASERRGASREAIARAIPPSVVLTVSVHSSLDREWMVIEVSDADREQNGEALKEGVRRAIDNGERLIDPWPSGADVGGGTLSEPAQATAADVSSAPPTHTRPIYAPPKREPMPDQPGVCQHVLPGRGIGGPHICGRPLRWFEGWQQWICPSWWEMEGACPIHQKKEPTP